MRMGARTAIAVMLALAVIATAVSEPASTARPLGADLSGKLIQAAVAQTATPVTYDGSYRQITYPGGDVPANIGVCTDLIVRAYRAVGVDLQVRVHEDMKTSFGSYPQLWGLSRADSNIDHRRVPNLQTYFRRHGAQLPISANADDYLPGDLVTWTLPGNLPHIGLVTNQRSSRTQRWLIVHNIGRGPEIEDMLFVYPISGHYRYRGD
jgi:uncharacterized protein YijF (DUF1287 family)